MKKFGSKSGPPSRAAGARGPKRPGPRTAAGAPPRKPFRRDEAAPARRSYTRSDDSAPPRRSYGRPDDSAPPRRSYGRGDDSAPPRKPFRRDEAGGAPARDFGDPYKHAARPARAPREASAEAGAGRGPARGFTVTLDPDVARVFRGDASVNKALRLVMQLVQVVQGPPHGEAGGARQAPRRGYQGSDEARGFTRKPRFSEDEE